MTTATKRKPLEPSTPSGELRRIHVNQLQQHDNVRRTAITRESVEDLMASILEFGQLQPIVASELGIDEYAGGKTEGLMLYKVGWGHRRTTAFHYLFVEGKHDGMVDVIVASEHLGQDERVVQQLIENLHRSDLNPVDEAFAFSTLTVEHKYKQKRLAEVLGRSPSYISDRLALLKLPDKVLNAVGEGRIPLQIGVKLSALPEKTVLKLTGDGAIAPQEYEISGAVRKAGVDELMAKMIGLIKEAGATKISKTYMPYGMKVLHKFESPEDFATLAKPIRWAEGVVAYVTSEGYGKPSVTISVARPETEKEKAAAQARREADRNKAIAKDQEQRAAQIEAERASWTDEFRAWKDECQRIRDEHAAAVRQYEADIHAAEMNWCRTVKASEVGRFAMIQVCRNAGNWGANNGAQPWQVCKDFGLEVAANDWDEVLRDFLAESASNQVAVTAYHTVVADPAGPARLARDAAVAKLDITAPANPVYPPQPGALTPDEAVAAAEEDEERDEHTSTVSGYDPDEEISDEEQAAIDDELAAAEAELADNPNFTHQEG